MARTPHKFPSRDKAPVRAPCRSRSSLEDDSGADLNLTGVGPGVVAVIPERRRVIDFRIRSSQKPVVENVVRAELKLKRIALVESRVLENAGVDVVPTVGAKSITADT